MQIPVFYANWEDDNHCLQAAVMMALAYKGLPTDWDGVEKLTLYDPRYWTWTFFGARALAKKLGDIKIYSDLDYGEFAKRGEEYLKEYWAPDWYPVQKEHSSDGFKREQEAAKDFIENGTYVETDSITAADIDTLLDENVLIALLDVGLLEDDGEPRGHFVFVYDKNDDSYILHDPGLPPREAMEVDKEDFIKALGEVITIPRN